MTLREIIRTEIKDQEAEDRLYILLRDFIRRCNESENKKIQDLKDWLERAKELLDK